MPVGLSPVHNGRTATADISSWADGQGSAPPSEAIGIIARDEALVVCKDSFWFQRHANDFA